MLGFIYSDYKDEHLEDPFHRFVCREFAYLSRASEEITSVVDPVVTSDQILQVFKHCDFIFYWGHGWLSDQRQAHITGSALSEVLPFSAIEKHLSCQLIYLDACEMGQYLNEYKLDGAQIICPKIHIIYRKSVLTGCYLMLNLLEGNQSFKDAFRNATAQWQPDNEYLYFGDNPRNFPAISDYTKSLLLRSFYAILGYWSKNQRY